ncbi:MAG: hypothetical protein DMF62_09240 [Acidobacteria bacterium]|nr:MAG: hypothetical protein DMF62_09240 [Acidobacteriota bacterium]
MSERPRKDSISTKTTAAALIVCSAIAAAMAGVLRLDGRAWWCKLGDRAIYINDAWNSSHTSQHFLDPYSFTHILHGVLMFWIAGSIFKKISPYWQLTIAAAAEAGWEILENSNFIIEKYRANTAALDYFGDSIANSVGDLLACLIGFWIAAKLGLWKSLAFFLAVELILLFWIRDSLLLSIVMLIYPIDTLKTWQNGA